MRRSVLSAFVLCFIVGLVPSVSASPVEQLDTDPVGHLSWLPADADQAGEVGAGQRRLVVTFYEEQAGAGVFGLKFQSVGAPVSVVEHPDFISSLDNLIHPAVTPVDQPFAGVAGDVRLGDCALIDDPTFHYAYSTTTVQAADYVAGECDVVTPIDDLSVSVKTYVPGFWVDVTEAGPYTELFYGTLYDMDGEGEDWYTEADDLSFSASVTP